ncbi:Polypeptide N-acetylgalactosaminyltransferase [Scophthalmus maximus]|uniref:Polypeptide N-acetylgalactosaminyltransferase n=1 Tax=Scophthalmus maximus TaxID=52904 RepID=A0A2U9BA44_SCOMX|nr:Polypeptide N-acetylgalactosaminyltransferase [Scophthalmus maximus]
MFLNRSQWSSDELHVMNSYRPLESDESLRLLSEVNCCVFMEMRELRSEQSTFDHLSSVSQRRSRTDESIVDEGERVGVKRMGKDAQVGRDGVRRKDWHDYDTIRRDASRSGNGEQGRAFPLTDTDRVDQAYRENGFNIYVSDRISLNRSVPDIRHAA